MTAPDPSPAAAIVDLAMLQMLIDAIPVSIYFKDLRGRFVRVNREHHRLLGLDDPAKVIGQTDFDFFTEAHSRQTCAEELEVIRTGRPIVDQEEKITCLDGREAWMSTTKFPWRESDGTIVGTIGLAREISRLNIAEEKLVEERNLLHQIIDLLPSRIYVKDRESRYLINNRAHLRSLGVERQEDALGRTAADFYSVARADQARADDRQVFSSGVPILDQEKSDFGPEGRTRWSLTAKVPLRDVRQEIVGLVGISHDITDRKRAEAELRLRSAEMEADLQLARRTQEALLPRDYPIFPSGVPPEMRTLHFAHRYVAASTLGGDFLDVIRVSDTEAGLAVCDVMGHGVRASLITAMIRGLIEQTHGAAHDPGAFLKELNRRLVPILRQSGLPGFVSMIYAVIDTAAGEVRWANAGHPPAFLLRREAGRVERLASADPEPATGLLEDFVYSSCQRKFAAGDALLLFTDGLFEATAEDGAMLGEEGLQEMVERDLALPGGQLIDRLVEEVLRFSGRTEFGDDICVLLAEATDVPVNLPLNYEI